MVDPITLEVIQERLISTVREMRGTVRAHSQEGRPGTLLVVDLPHAGVGP